MHRYLNDWISYILILVRKSFLAKRVLLTGVAGGVHKIIVDVVSSVPRDSLSEVGGQTVPEHDHLNPHQSQLLLFPLPVSVDNVVLGRSGYTSLKDEGEAPARAAFYTQL